MFDNRFLLKIEKNLTEDQHVDLIRHASECFVLVEDILTGKSNEAVILDGVTKIMPYEGSGHGVRVIFENDVSWVFMTEMSDDDYGHMVYIKLDDASNQIATNYFARKLGGDLRNMLLMTHSHLLGE